MTIEFYNLVRELSGQYAGIETISQKQADLIISIIRSLPLDHLILIADSDVKFITPCAQSEIIRRAHILNEPETQAVH